MLLDETNACHTLNRYFCNLVDPKVYSDYLLLKANTIDSHLLYGAPECAKKIFYGENISSNYINVYFITFASIVGLLFL